MNYINKSDVTIRIKVLLTRVLKNKSKCKKYIRECEKRNINLTPLGEVRFNVPTKLTIKELFNLLDLLIEII